MRRQASGETIRIKQNGVSSHPLLLTPHLAAVAFLAAALTGCGALTPRPSAPPPPTDAKAPPPTTSPRPGGYYLDDGPGANPPANLDEIPDAVPKAEPVRPANARPYVAMGVSYRPMFEPGPYKARGLATWYGRRYHGKPTASGEPYDMYAMTAAHTILPIPSYARVTNVQTGRSVIVRINDRGPFVEGRVIDVSYTAAHKLGILAGATQVEVESIIPGGSGSSIVAAQAQPRPSGQPSGSVVAAPLPEKEKLPAATALAPDERVAKATPPVTVPAPVPAAPAPPPVTTEGGRVFLQLGAFASRENADGFLTRIRTQADWLPAQIVSRDGLHRVQAGPYSSRNEAQQTANRLGEALGIKPMVLTK